MATKIIPPKLPPAAQKAPDPYRCPKCKVEVDPVATGERHEDSDGVKCEVYRCPTKKCGWEEGRPIAGV
jgi:hypothetical protein